MKRGVRFEVRDRLGRLIRLTEDSFQRHVEKRPEQADYLEEAKLTIAEPDYELQDEESGSYCYVRHGLGHGRHEKCFVKVIVRFQSEELGEVRTFWLPDKIGRGRIVWKRTRT